MTPIWIIGENTGHSMVTPLARSLITLEFSIAFAPFIGYLAFGLLFLPIQLVVLVTDPLSVDALVPVTMLLGTSGIVGLYHLLNWILYEKAGTFGWPTVSICLAAGMLALVPTALILAPELRVFAVLAFFATCHFMWLGRDYRQRT